MRAGRLFIVSMLALAVSGCIQTAMQRAAVTPQSDLDDLMYQNRTATPLAVPPPTPSAYAAPVPAAIAAPPLADAPDEPPYTLDSGDRLRVVVFGQDGLSNSYTVAAGGQITLPLIGVVPARGTTTEELARTIGDKLRRGYIREPHVAIEVESYRPFFILGEVTFPGQYPYVPNMTVETAVAIAGGFTPRAYRWDVHIDRPVSAGGGRSRGSVPLLTRVRPGDTVIIKERWF
jgi:polysaccharide export outer membrane protein